ncbi:hypothetical protein CF319_g8136 [Tilletia indica]|nr:hypothetical protein CF319_g8136 [Tilletia indica]
MGEASTAEATLPVLVHPDNGSRNVTSHIPLEASTIRTMLINSASSMLLSCPDQTAPRFRGSDYWRVMLKKGAQSSVQTLSRSDASSLARFSSAGLEPGTLSRRRLSRKSIVRRVESLSATPRLCALVMSGISDPYELCEHVHISEVGISIGSSIGGMQSLSAMFRDRGNNIDVQKDIVQETFINLWMVNLLLISSSGPIKTPVGACVMALQSVEIAAETILSGKAKVMLAGGFDDFRGRTSDRSHSSIFLPRAFPVSPTFRPPPVSLVSPACCRQRLFLVLRSVSSVTLPGGVLPTTGLPGVTDILPGTALPGVTDIIPTGVPSVTLPSVVLPTADLSDSTLQQQANHIHQTPAYLNSIPWTCSAAGFVAPASHSSSIFVP